MIVAVVAVVAVVVVVVEAVGGSVAAVAELEVSGVSEILVEVVSSRLEVKVLEILVEVVSNRLSVAGAAESVGVEASGALEDFVLPSAAGCLLLDSYF